MKKEIKEKVENKRQEIKLESERLRKRAKEIHKCPNCGKPVEPRRLYCSNKCSIEFQHKYDYSQNSEILKEYKRQLTEEEKNKHPQKEMKSVTHPVARKNYTCELCKTEIPKGQKYYKYTVLPGDADFYDYPYENYRYHLKCIDFLGLMGDAGMLMEEGYDEDEIEVAMYAIAIELHQDYNKFIQNIIEGKFPTLEFLEKLEEEYEFFDPDISYKSDNLNYKYIYAVKFYSRNKIKGKVFITYRKVENPEEFFKEYYSGYYIHEFVSIEFLKVPLKPVENQEVLKL